MRIVSVRDIVEATAELEREMGRLTQVERELYVDGEWEPIPADEYEEWELAA
jgi:hypothetical protein